MSRRRRRRRRREMKDTYFILNDEFNLSIFWTNKVNSFAYFAAFDTFDVFAGHHGNRSLFIKSHLISNNDSKKYQIKTKVNPFLFLLIFVYSLMITSIFKLPLNVYHFTCLLTQIMLDHYTLRESSQLN